MVVCAMNGAIAIAWGGNRRGCSTLLTIVFFLQLILASSYTAFSRPISHSVSSLQRPSQSKLKDIGGELGFSSSEHGSKPLKGVVASSPMQFHIQEEFSLWPCGDQLDKNIFKLLFPAILNFAIVPLVGAADTFWVGRMRNALALAGQGAANQLFNSAFWFFSFLPSVVTPLIAKARGADDETALQQRIAEAFFVATITGILGTLLLTVNPAWVLSLVLKSDSSARVFAEPYLLFRGLTVIPALLSTVGFAVFRGTMDVVTPLKISLIANMVNILLDPVFIFPAKMGVVGAAVATCISEITSFALYMYYLSQCKLLQGIRRGIPSLKALAPLLIGGLSIQLRSVALNTALLSVTRTAQRLDSVSGSVAAAHTISMQMFQLGSVASLAMGTVAAIIIPVVLGNSKNSNKNSSEGSPSPASPASAESFTAKQNYHTLLLAKQSGDRILVWGALLGLLLAALQAVAAGPLLRFFSPLTNVQSIARGPCLIGAALQFLNCLVWAGEGIQQGHQSFLSLALATVLGTIGMLGFVQYTVPPSALATLAPEHALSRVWLGFVVLALTRLVATMSHHFLTGPLAIHKLKALRTAFSSNISEDEKVH